MYNQIYSYFQAIFSKFQCRFRKGFNALHCLLAMVEKWRKTLDEDGETGAVLMDLSKSFHCIDHNLLIAKLNANGFEKRSINFIYSCLTKRKQKLYIYIQYIYICDMFFETPANIDFVGYADDHTLYKYSSNIENVLHNLQGVLKRCFIGSEQITW